MYMRLAQWYKLKSPYTPYMYAPIGMMHIVIGLILDKVSFDTFS